MKDLFTVTEVAKMIRVSVPTVNRWLNLGELKGFRPAKNANWKISKTKLIHYMKKHNIPMEFLNSGKVKILVVDDEEYVTKTIETLMKNSDTFDVAVAHSGFSAGIKLESFEPDIIILDIFLGDMDGRELLEHIRQHEQFSNTKVIGMSGKLKDDELDELKSQGFDEFIKKPFKRATIINVINKLIEEK